MNEVIPKPKRKERQSIPQIVLGIGPQSIDDCDVPGSDIAKSLRFAVQARQTPLTFQKAPV